MAEEDVQRHVLLEVTRALIAEWHSQLNLGALNEKGLVDLRNRLRDPESTLIEGPEVDQLLIRVDKAVAEVLGVDPGDLPGSLLAMPDSPEGLEGD